MTNNLKKYAKKCVPITEEMQSEKSDNSQFCCDEAAASVITPGTQQAAYNQGTLLYGT